MDIMNILFLIGRILFGGYFFINSLNHFMYRDMLAGYAASKGVPMAKLAVPFAGLFIFLGGLGIVLGIYVKIAVALIVLFLLPVSFMMHPYWKESEQTQMTDKVNFTKNMALLGAALMLLLISVPWPLSLMKWLPSLR